MEKLIDSDSDDETEEVSTSPGEVSRPVANPPREVKRSNTGLFRGILLIILAVVLVILIVLFARWLYHATHYNSQTTQTGTNTASQTSSSLKKQSTSQTQTSRPSTTNNSSTPTTSSNSNLPNSGAGNVIAIFAGASLAAAGLHYIISIRRSNKSVL